MTKSSKFGAYFLYRLKRLRTFMILSGVFALLAFPLYSLIAVTADKFFMGEGVIGIEPNEINVLSLCICILAIAFLAVVGYFITVSTFSYLHKKTLVDMELSLPVSSSQRFWGNFLAGATAYFAPFFLSVIIGLGIYLPNLSVFDSDKYIGKISYYSSGFQLYDIDILIKLVITMFAAMVLLYVITTLVLHCTGSTAEACIYPIVVMIFLPLAIAILVYLTFYNSDSNVIDISELLAYAISWCSPIALTLGTILGLQTDFSRFGIWNSELLNTEYNKHFLIESPNIFITIIIFTVVCIVLSLYLANKRKAENTGKSFAFEAPYQIILTIVTFAVFELIYFANYMFKPESWVVETDVFIAVIPALIVYFIIDIIKNKGFKKVGVKLIRYAITAAACILITIGLNHSNAFGITDYVPDKSEIESIDARVERLDNVSSGGSRYISYTSEKAIDILLQLHNDCVKQNNGTNSEKNDVLLEKALVNTDTMYNNGTNHVYLRYHLKDGRQINRGFYLYSDTSYSYALAEEENAKGIKLDAYSQFENIINFGSYDGYSLEFTDVKQKKKQSFSGILPEEIYALYKEDYLNQTTEQILNPDKAPSGIIIVKLNVLSNSEYEYTAYLEIMPWFEKTLEMLSDKGIETYSLFDSVGDTVGIGFVSDFSEVGNGEFQNNIGVAEVDTSNPDVRKLIETAVPRCVPTKNNRFVLKLSDYENYWIADEYIPLAEKLFKETLGIENSLDGAVYTISFITMENGKDILDYTGLEYYKFPNTDDIIIFDYNDYYYKSAEEVSKYEFAVIGDYCNSNGCFINGVYPNDGTINGFWNVKENKIVWIDISSGEQYTTDDISEDDISAYASD